MLIATAVIGVVFWIALCKTPIPKTQLADLRHVLGAGLVAGLLLVLILGMIRGGQRR